MTKPNACEEVKKLDYTYTADKKVWKIVGQFLKKLDMQPSYDPAITLLGIYPQEKKKTCKWMFIADIFLIAKKWEAIQMFFNR